MSFQYREISPRDWEQVEPLLQELHRVHHELRPNWYAERTNLQRDNYSSYFFGTGCFDGDKLIGLCWGYIKTNGLVKSVGWVEDLIVTKEFRGIGIGGDLLRRFISQCRQQGAAALQLGADARNGDALDFYDHMGMGLFSLFLYMDI